MNPKWFNKDKDEWLRHIISVHFNPKEGTPYWLRFQRERGIDALREINCTDDLLKLGPMDERKFAELPIEEFIPKYLLENKSQILTAETGCTTGVVKHAAYSVSEFRQSFSDFFYSVAVKRDFPGHLNWLFAGPSGPHIIWYCAVEMAKKFGAMRPFAIDFDPRWVKKMNPQSMPFKRYKTHIAEQSLRIIRTQNIGILFTTPDIACTIAEELKPGERDKIRGIHLGGLPLMPNIYEKLRAHFMSAVIIPGYGNTLFGLTLEIKSPDNKFNVTYYPPGPRLIIEILKLSNNNGTAMYEKADYGERGRVAVHRLDEAFFIPNLIERDEAERTEPLQIGTWQNGKQDGIRNPASASDTDELTVREGLY